METNLILNQNKQIEDTPSVTADPWSNKPPHEITDLIESKSSYIIEKMVELAEEIGMGYEENLEFKRKRAEAKNAKQMEDDWHTVDKQFFLSLENNRLEKELVQAREEIEENKGKTSELEQALAISEDKKEDEKEVCAISATENKLFSVKEVSTLLNICTSSVYNLIENKELTSVKIGRTIRIPAKSVRALVGSDIC